jgi:hypothetical protein
VRLAGGAEMGPGAWLGTAKGAPPGGGPNGSLGGCMLRPPPGTRPGWDGMD